MMSSISDIVIYDPVMDIRLTFGEWLADTMAQQGITQVELADRLGVAQSTISNWVTNDSLPTRRNATDLARVLEEDADDITERVGQARRRRAPERAKGGQQTQIIVRGRVPASTTVWIDYEGHGRVIDVPKAWVRESRSELFAVEVFGECLAERKIHDGDIVICEAVTDPSVVMQGRIVLVRVGDEYTLKVWHWVGHDRAELRDSYGVVVVSLSGRDDFEILGIARRRLGDID